MQTREKKTETFNEWLALFVWIVLATFIAYCLYPTIRYDQDNVARVVRICWACGFGIVLLFIAARSRIVEGAVGMVEMALQKIEERKTVALDSERKAAMVSNLLVVLCSERPTQQIINAGSLYT